MRQIQPWTQTDLAKSHGFVVHVKTASGTWLRARRTATPGGESFPMSKWRVLDLTAPAMLRPVLNNACAPNFKGYPRGGRKRLAQLRKDLRCADRSGHGVHVTADDLAFLLLRWIDSAEWDAVLSCADNDTTAASFLFVFAGRETRA